MRLSWRTRQLYAADHQDATLALGMPEPWINRAVAAGHLLLILLVAVVLRIRGLDRYSLWYDEVVTMRLARTANPAALIRLLGEIDGTRAPLHPLILQGWLRLFGTSEVAGRSFSAVCGIVTVLVVYRLGQRLFDEPTGRWAAWFTAVCPPLVYYSQEARMYAWLVLLTCLSWLVFIEFRHADKWGNKIAYWLLLTGLVYSHPLGLFMVAAHGLAYLLVHRSLALRISAVAGHPGGRPAGRCPMASSLSRPRNRLSASSVLDPLLACRAHRVHRRQQPCFAVLLLIIAAGLFSLDGRQPRLTRPVESLVLLSWMIVPPVLMFIYSQASTTDLRPAALSSVHCSRLPDPAGPRIDRAPANSPLDARGGSSCLVAFPAGFQRLQSTREVRLESTRSVAEPRGQTRGFLGAKRTRHRGRPSQRSQVSARRDPRGPLLSNTPSSRPAGRRVGHGRTRRPPGCDSRRLLPFRPASAPGVRNLSDTGFSAPIWQRAATDFHHGVPELYGLIIRRR